MTGGDSENPKNWADALMQTCGERAGLIVEAALSFPGYDVTDFIRRTVRCGDHSWIYQPYLQALQEELNPGGCSCFGRLKMNNWRIAGSTAAGLDVEDEQAQGRSDKDIMCEFGPVKWVSQSEASGEMSPQEHQEDSSLADARPRLMLATTDNAGFYMVLREPKSSCKHEVPLVFSASDIRHLSARLCDMVFKSWTEFRFYGPAASANLRPTRQPLDFVPCLRLAHWPDLEVFDRLQSCNLLPADVLQEMRDFGLHLVPVGYPGSVSEEKEWRASFSHSELLTAWHLAPIQKRTMIALKKCKWQLGEGGTHLRSYFLLTTLFWVCSETPLNRWTTIQFGVTAVLSRLTDALASHFLPCFFMKDINILQSVPPGEVSTILDTVVAVQQQLTSLLLRSVCQQGLVSFFRPLTDAIWQRADVSATLEEDQLRVCLVRGIITNCARLELLQTMFRTFARVRLVTCKGPPKQVCDDLLNRIDHLRSWHHNVQLALLKALVIAPEAVSLRVRMIKTSDVTWTLDAQPLVELLTAKDISLIFSGEQEDFYRWYSRKSQQPVDQRVRGLTANPRTRRGLTQLVTNIPMFFRLLLNMDATFGIETAEVAAAVVAQIKLETVPFVMLRRRVLSLGPRVKKVAAYFLALSETNAEKFVECWMDHALNQWTSEDARDKYERLFNPNSDPWRLTPYRARYYRF